MMKHNRPQFRKKLVLNQPTQPSIYKNLNVSYKNISKLTPHKVKKTANSPIPKLRNVKNMGVNLALILGFKKNIFNNLGQVVQSIWTNYLGISMKFIGIKGITFSSYLKFYQINTYKIYSTLKANTLWAAPTPIFNIITGKNRLASRKPLIGFFSKNNELELFSSKKKLLSASFYIGLPETFNYHTYSITSRVRGVAKNPIDHPNGGRANTKGSFKTPWGSYAKNNK